MKKFLPLILILLLVIPAFSKSVKVTDFGAIPDGKTNNAISIQKAIDACAASGGGSIIFEAGRYLSSTVALKSNIDIRLEAGATLLASRNKMDYTISKGIYSTETDVPVLLMAFDLENISISGTGTIDGQAEHTWEDLREVDNFIKTETEGAKAAGIEMKRAYALDPKVSLVYFVNCKHVYLENIRLLHSPNWTIHLANNDDVAIRGIYLYSSLDKGVNADGIDIDGCKNVRISDCNIITGDDAICLKSTNKDGKFTACENIVVNNCTLQSTSTALKIGTESHGDFRNIIFSNSVITNTNRGIGIFVRDGALVEKVMFLNLIIHCDRKHFNWWGDGDPIRFVLLKRKPESRLGIIKDIRIENVVAVGQGSSLIAGYESRQIENIELKNVSIEMQAEDLADKRAENILNCRNINQLKLENVSLTWKLASSEPKWKYALSLENVQDFRLRENEFQVQNPGFAAIFLKDCKQGKLLSNTLLTSKSIFSEITGAGSLGIQFQANSFIESQLYKRSAEVKKEAISEVR